MENQTSITEFHIISFSLSAKHRPLVFFAFLWLFLMGIFMNIVIIIVICDTKHLHNPMYCFLCNLAISDIYFPSTTIPYLLYMLWSGNNTISFTKCFTQIYFFFIACGAEILLLVFMAYDRYVAICKPLHYDQILNKQTCALLNFLTWTIGSLNSLLLTVPATKMTFCHSNSIKHYFCDTKALTEIACAGIDTFYTAYYVELFIMGFCPVLSYFVYYGKVIRVVLRIKSREGRQKAFSTCSSHIIVIFIYFGSAIVSYFMPSSENFALQQQVITALYANVTPMVNPLIYSLRSKELKQAIQKLFRKLCLV